ncbi:tRNAHis guanylyltransferase [Yasminevirus sp. GU-2018]|uniref:tRNAHis guanylyltransferase n=1 Tax=Yasminevirus sp. GU-2018 TaxID=2420051 RepID=A0A5K0U7Q1_9VIRU|nr:tRNAHis guanylyltransferase [Yasminevirus sp. GU-2018]
MDSHYKQQMMNDSNQVEIKTHDHTEREDTDAVKQDEFSDEKTIMGLGDRMKSYETTEVVPPYQAFIVRADGNCFSKFTSGFPKPFDSGFLNAVVKTGNGVMDHFNAKTVFSCSDEITLVFPAICTKAEYDELVAKGEKNLPTHTYSGRRTKIETLVASKCSVLFNIYMLEELNKDRAKYSDVVQKRIEACSAIFDARLIAIPIGSEIEIVNNVIWRSCYDCHRNTTSTYARHVLGQKACFKKNSQEMIVLMKDAGFDYVADVPLWYRYGVLGKKIQVKMSNEKGEFMRTADYNFSTNLMLQDRVKTLELFLGKYFVDDKIESVKYAF